MADTRFVFPAGKVYVGFIYFYGCSVVKNGKMNMRSGGTSTLTKSLSLIVSVICYLLIVSDILCMNVSNLEQSQQKEENCRCFKPVTHNSRQCAVRQGNLTLRAHWAFQFTHTQRTRSQIEFQYFPNLLGQALSHNCHCIEFSLLQRCVSSTLQSLAVAGCIRPLEAQ